MDKPMKRIQWRVEHWEVSKLKPYEKNPRIITESGLEQLKKSFDEIGMAQPININTDGTVLSGHARLMQLKAEGITSVDVYVPDRELTAKQEEAVVIRMNRSVIGKWDMDLLAEEFEIEDLKEWGFDESEFSRNEEDLSGKNKEIDTTAMGSDMEHVCPRCGFEFNE